MQGQEPQPLLPPNEPHGLEIVLGLIAGGISWLALFTLWLSDGISGSWLLSYQAWRTAFRTLFVAATLLCLALARRWPFFGRAALAANTLVGGWCLYQVLQ